MMTRRAMVPTHRLTPEQARPLREVRATLTSARREYTAIYRWPCRYLAATPDGVLVGTTGEVAEA